jgi:hypothetical protein
VRPNTWLHRPACKREENPCQLGAVHTWHFPAVAAAAKDGRSRLESGRWRSAARWLPEREQRIAELEQEIDQSADRGGHCRGYGCATRAGLPAMGRAGGEGCRGARHPSGMSKRFSRPKSCASRLTCACLLSAMPCSILTFGRRSEDSDRAAASPAVLCFRSVGPEALGP